MALTPTTISTTEGIKKLLDSVAGLPNDPPSLYLDLEGIKLSRHGSISIVCLYVKPAKAVYLIDVHALGSTAFTTTSSRATTLKAVLESATTTKVFFDVRNDSDALFSHYGIHLNGIEDNQLMECATRSGNKTFVHGLVKCIEADLKLAAGEKARWHATKDRGHRLFDPAKGGKYELYEKYKKLLPSSSQAFWLQELQIQTAARIKDSQSPNYQPWSKEKPRSPWDDEYLQEAMDAWNDDIMDEHLHNLELEEQALEDAFDFDYDCDDYDYDDFRETARDCDGWEEDMIKNGSPF